jgi:hypothetical protein
MPDCQSITPVTRHPVRDRLWIAAIGVGVFLLVFIAWNVANSLRNPSHKLAMGHDLLPSYAAGTLVRKGTPRLMYERSAVQAVESSTIRDADLEMDARYGPWLNPPFFAWVFAPLSALPYRSAALIFLCANLLMLGTALSMLVRMFVTSRAYLHPAVCLGSPPPVLRGRVRVGAAWSISGRSSHAQHSDASGSASPVKPCPHPSPPPEYRGREKEPRRYFHARPPSIPWQAWALVPLLVLLPPPFWQALCHQQNTFISLLLLTAATACWRRGRGFTAGVFAGLLFFKPQLAAVFALALIVGLGWRAVAGLAVTGSVLLAITLFTLPWCLGDFLHRLPPTLHWLQMEAPYNWGRQVTFQSFWRLLIQGHVRGDTQIIVKIFWWICSSAVFVSVAAAAWRHVRSGRNVASRDRLIAAAIASMPLVMPYYMDYDLLLLAIPAVLFAAEWVHRPAAITRTDRWLLAAWALFCLETFFNPGLAGHSRFNLAVPLLATISALHTVRCFRRDHTQQALPQPANEPIAVAA